VETYPMASATRQVGLRGRLLALVLVPTIVAALLAGSAASSKRNAAKVASEVHEEVGALIGLVDMRTALMSARIPVEVQVRSAALGVDPDEVLDLLNLAGQDFGDLADVKARLRQLPADVRPFSPGELDELRQAIRNGPDLDVIDRFTRLEVLADDAWEDELAVVQRQSETLSHPDIGDLLRDLDRSARLTSAMASTVTGLADYWFADMAGLPRIEAARVQLGIANYRFDRLVSALTKSPVPEVADGAETLLDQKSSGLLQEAVGDALAGRPAAPLVDGIDIGLMASTFTNSFELVEPSLALMDGRSNALDASVERYAARAARMSMLTFVGLLAMMAVLVVISLFVAASFERPLRRLIDGARRIGSGDLHVEPLPVGGPAEIGEATAAFNDVVGNLRLLEGKLDALADTDFDDPRLDDELPGELGQSLARSVEVLSSSIHDRATLQARLAHQATHDMLTGIPNRAGGLAALEGALARSRRQSTTLALAFLDLDGFKKANDRYGHHVGDAVLCEVAERLRRHARSGDSYARLGGDEFVVIGENVPTPAAALAFARRIAAVVAQPIPAGEHLIDIGVSIGVALAPAGRDSVLNLLAHADRAAYRAKRSGTEAELYDNVLDGGTGDLLGALDPPRLPSDEVIDLDSRP
jgi:diguanylate cyclase (GGDEF)-like protein